ncbi:putative ribonuclease [Gordonia araii NBRC 100433]|uniref:Putative ribonuclease n=1 Tax=Gordonia araii NBRC 100433 TaxID=1073574 RepID=G7GYP0_9ACTN|nr:YhjD/YihY/BrkB family envelope integrity protein [Gordonia araii]NNG99248.1 inner membrane protein YhjD [Gordonia araii NBRC 100433]GAB08715.1 putative ribonuclease [Gordonia araii NBRC 100433]
MPSLPPPIAVVVDPVVALFTAIVARVSALITALTDGLKELRRRFPRVDRLVSTMERHDEHYGGAFAAAMSFRTVMALVPVLMVAFAVAGFILSRRPELLDDIRQAIVDAVPGNLGETLANAMDSAIRSRSTVGTLGLVFAAWTGINWMSGAREAMTAIWGGKVERNPVLSKVYDLGQFALLGLWFVVALVLSAAGSSALADTVLVWLNLDWSPVAVSLFKVVAPIVSVLITWPLLTVVLAKVPLVNLPLRNAWKAGLLAAVAFEALKAAAGMIIAATSRGPAGAAFGSIITVMMFINVVARIMFYATAWCATDPINAEYLLDDQDAIDADPDDGESADDEKASDLRV